MTDSSIKRVDDARTWQVFAYGAVKTLSQLSQLLDFAEDAVQIVAMQPEHGAIRPCLLEILEPSFLMNRSDSRYLKIFNGADISIS